MSQQPIIAAPPTAEQRTEIARTAKALAAALLPSGPSVRRPAREFSDAVTPGVVLALLAESDELRTRFSQAEAERDALALLADAEAFRAGQPIGGATLLIWCQRYGDEHALDYLFDKLSRRCPVGKALIERAEKAEAANDEACQKQIAELKQELAERECKHKADKAELGAVLASLYDDDLHPVSSFIGNDFKAGVNHERKLMAKMIELKARELGLPWPLPAEDYHGMPAPAAVLTTTGEGKSDE